MRRSASCAPDAIAAFERDYIRHALILAHGVKRNAALILGISRKNLWEKSRRLGIGTEHDNGFDGEDEEARASAPPRPRGVKPRPS